MRSLAQYFKGAKAYRLMSQMEARGEDVLVPVSEATLRAAICSSGAPGGAPCPQNQDVHKTAFEKGTDAMMAKRVGADRPTPYDDQLQVCATCSCNLKTIIHLKGEIVVHGADQEFFAEHPSFCWKQAYKK